MHEITGRVSKNTGQGEVVDKVKKCQMQRKARCCLCTETTKMVDFGHRCFTLHFYDFGAEEAKALDMHKKWVYVGR